MDKVTHYRRTKMTAVCGRSFRPAHGTNEIGHVSCSDCNRRIRVAGFRAMGYTDKVARQMARGA